MFNLLSYKPTEQETHFIELISKMLKHPVTIVKTTPLSRKFFLVNEDLHYYVRITHQGIQITNSKFSFAKPLHEKVHKIIVDNVHEYLESECSSLDDKIFRNENDLLEEVKTKLEIV
jgi:hypothetical protein